MQSPDWRKILHVMYSGMLTSPVRRSEKARLHNNTFVFVLKWLFFKIRIKTSPLVRTINIPNVIGGMSSFALKLSDFGNCDALFDWRDEMSGSVLLMALDKAFAWRQLLDAWGRKHKSLRADPYKLWEGSDSFPKNAAGNKNFVIGSNV